MKEAAAHIQYSLAFHPLQVAEIVPAAPIFGLRRPPFILLTQTARQLLSSTFPQSFAFVFSVEMAPIPQPVTLRAQPRRIVRIYNEAAGSTLLGCSTSMQQPNHPLSIRPLALSPSKPEDQHPLPSLLSIPSSTFHHLSIYPACRPGKAPDTNVQPERIR